ncbi:hypothetical protein [Agromyces sp. NPDC058110]|uniref:hypothetical protein n=1 Tax=Agromyces sp. NPDC058110 TaxID=3346345 RepID=UPI0036DDF458
MTGRSGPRPLRRWRALLALVGGLSLLLLVPAPTAATWADPEFDRGTVQAGVVNPPTGLTCAVNNAFSWRLSWTPPATGLPAVQYRISVVAVVAANDGNRPRLASTLLPPGETSVILYSDPARNPASALTVTYQVAGGAQGAFGRGSFQVVAVDAGGWTSTPTARTLRTDRTNVNDPRWTPLCP